MIVFGVVVLQFNEGSIMKLPMLFVVGDSISVQYGPYLEQYLKGRLDYVRRGGEDELAAINLNIPQGANRGDSTMVLAYLQARQNHDPINADLLMINCGLHDIKTDPTTRARLVPIELYQENLRRIVDIVRLAKPQMIWVATTPCDESVHNHAESLFLRFRDDVKAYNAAAQEIMERAGIPVLDLYTFTVNLGDNLYCDHVHFTETVRHQQAAFIAGWVSAWYAMRTSTPRSADS